MAMKGVPCLTDSGPGQQLHSRFSPRYLAVAEGQRRGKFG